ncbi:FAD-binding domain-containing protein [Streptomyces sp. NRRL F-5053]|uniref:FAD-binding domain-containing protein n=1 Tax=Streptomyces sp. NRRL F-5053 TaxID=1463854 RepID=UPI00099C151C
MGSGHRHGIRPNRVLTPVSRGKRYDPGGSYVRRSVPELSSVNGPAPHEPWKRGTRAAADPSGRRTVRGAGAVRSRAQWHNPLRATKYPTAGAGFRRSARRERPSGPTTALRGRRGPCPHTRAPPPTRPGERRPSAPYASASWPFGGRAEPRRAGHRVGCAASGRGPLPQPVTTDAAAPMPHIGAYGSGRRARPPSSRGFSPAPGAHGPGTLPAMVPAAVVTRPRARPGG